jgi:hypothetical protein
MATMFGMYPFLKTMQSCIISPDRLLGISCAMPIAVLHHGSQRGSSLKCCR